MPESSEQLSIPEGSEQLSIPNHEHLGCFGIAPSTIYPPGSCSYSGLHTDLFHYQSPFQTTNPPAVPPTVGRENTDRMVQELQIMRGPEPEH